MTYEEFIQNILDTRGRFNCDGYKERHHIIPKCMGGTNDENNLIDLYGREHYEAHKLLAEENPDNNALTFAFWMMAHINREKHCCSAEEYEEARGLFTNRIRGERHHNYGKRPSKETRRKLSEAHRGEKNHMYGKPGIWRGKRIPEKTRKKMSLANNNKRKVMAISISNDDVCIYDSLCEASRVTGARKGHIWDCCNGNRKSAAGYIWKYA